MSFDVIAVVELYPKCNYISKNAGHPYRLIASNQDVCPIYVRL